MAVTQYVGARYVPHGWTDWNAETSYDALYVVKYNLAWYIAKKPVPVGTKPTCEKYWAMTDNWNGQVEEYRKSFEAFKSETESELTELNNTTNNLTNRVNVIENNHTEFYLMVADSYMEWINTTASTLRWKSSDYYTTARGGAGFITAGQGKTFGNLVDDVPSNIKAKVTQIVLITAGNDLNQTPENFSNAVNSFAHHCYTIFPKIKRIHIGACISRWNPGSMKFNIIRVLNNQYGVYFMEHSPAFANCSYLIKQDHVHLTPEGYNNIGKGVACYLQGVPFINRFNSMIEHFTQDTGTDITVQTYATVGGIYANINGVFVPGEGNENKEVFELGTFIGEYPDRSTYWLGGGVINGLLNSRTLHKSAPVVFSKDTSNKFVLTGMGNISNASYYVEGHGIIPWDI